MREDGFINTVIGHGLRRFDPMQNYQYVGAGSKLTDQELDDLFTYNGIAHKIITAPANEAVRAGVTFLGEDKAELPDEDRLQSALEDLCAWPVFAEAMSWNRLYGGAAILMICDDGRALDEPLNLASAKNIRKLEVFEPPEIQVHDDYFISDPSDIDYGKPEYYTLIGYNGNSFLVHASRLLVMNGDTVSKRVRRMRNGWGGRVLDRIRDDVMRYNSGLSLSLMILSRLSQGILKLDGMTSLLATDDGEQAIQKRLQLIDMARHIMNTIALDKEDEYDIKNITTAGVKDILEQFQMALCSTTDIPATVLFGRSPDGENATGKADQENYYAMIARIQQRVLRPCLARLVEVLGACRDYRLRLPTEYTIEFNPLWVPSEKEEAEVKKLEAEGVNYLATAAKTLLDIGALDSSEVRKKLKQGDTFKIDDSLDKELTEGSEDVDNIEKQNTLSAGNREGVQQNPSSARQ